jgi:O-acetyl-ADP-ribose deacetylase (regulator of RNase III)
MVINSDLLSVTTGVIAQQCNCQGFMGRGLALIIRKKYPQVYNAYWIAFLRGQLHLGMIQPVQVAPDRWVVNMMMQDGVGTQHRMTDYGAHEVAWPKLAAWAEHRQVHAPWGIGAGLGGGDFEVIQPIAEQAVPGIVWHRR